VPHPDDEIACAVLLQRSREKRAVFATDGAPAEFFWMHYGSREHPFQDQELFASIPPAIKALEEVAHRFQPDALLAPAYEGGQPDHDTCSFLVSVVGQKLSIPQWGKSFLPSFATQSTPTPGVSNSSGQRASAVSHSMWSASA
jgi:LmbE family N-acetylglucosaminyl deacetylase